MPACGRALVSATLYYSSTFPQAVRSTLPRFTQFELGVGTNPRMAGQSRGYVLKALYLDAAQSLRNDLKDLKGELYCSRRPTTVDTVGTRRQSPLTLAEQRWRVGRTTSTRTTERPRPCSCPRPGLSSYLAFALAAGQPAMQAPTAWPVPLTCLPPP